jgi:hypothetical protein
MNIIVGIFAGLGILFAGGCLLVGAAQFPPLGAILFAVVALNGIVLWALSRKSVPAAWCLIGIGLIDLGIVVLLVFFSSRELAEVIALAAILVGIKGGCEIACGTAMLRNRV